MELRDRRHGDGQGDHCEQPGGAKTVGEHALLKEGKLFLLEIERISAKRRSKSTGDWFGKTRRAYRGQVASGSKFISGSAGCLGSWSRR